MIEKVNPSHPDKIADRIAGAIVDLAYKHSENPRVAVEVLIGHGECNIIVECSEDVRDYLIEDNIIPIVLRICGNVLINYKCVIQDKHLAENQKEEIRCGDNGIFAGIPLTEEEKALSTIARDIYDKHPTDGKYILCGNELIICQSDANSDDLRYAYNRIGYETTVNPLGDWVGGIDTDSGATNRKLGSDMAHSVTGGGIHGKDLSKADVSINIYCFQLAQRYGIPIITHCAIGDTCVTITINGVDVAVAYEKIVHFAREYINEIGGFEKFAEWGLF